MKKTRWEVFVLCTGIALVGASSAKGQSSGSEALAGEWVLTSEEWGIRSSERLELGGSADKLNGKLYVDGNHIHATGSAQGRGIRLEWKDDDQTVEYLGTIEKDGMVGTFTVIGKAGRRSGTWTARRTPNDKPPSPRVLDFTPTRFYRQFSASVEPVLRIWPGDTVRTKSVDAGGQDEWSEQRVAGGNPLTGPFYIEGAMPGDVLAVTIKHLRINRDWASADSGLVGRALTSHYAAKFQEDWKEVRWHLDREKQVATPENPPEHLKNFSVPLRPMLGCVGVAPDPWDAPPTTQDSGDFGGNLDFKGIREGATLFLQVNQPGALLYLGDAHAVQGDGELNGNALETSMDIEFSVEVLREKQLPTPRVEDPESLMTIGLAGSLDEAFRGRLPPWSTG